MAIQDLTIALPRERKRRRPRPQSGPPGAGIGLLQGLLGVLGIFADNDIPIYSMLVIVTLYGLWHETRRARGLTWRFDILILGCSALILARAVFNP